MAIEKRNLGTEDDGDIITLGSSMEVMQEPSRQDMIRDAAEILVTEKDILVDDEIGEMDEALQVDFNANLVDFLDKSDLNLLAGDVLQSIDADKESRSDWEKTYTDGLKYLGMKFDDARSTPFQGSSGVIHPILAEAVTQFQAQAYKELLPAKGPVKTEIMGARTPEVEAQAERVQEFMNFFGKERGDREAFFIAKLVNVPLKKAKRMIGPGPPSRSASRSEPISHGGFAWACSPRNLPKTAVSGPSRG
jgi:hypothetical protein